MEKIFECHTILQFNWKVNMNMIGHASNINKFSTRKIYESHTNFMFKKQFIHGNCMLKINVCSIF